MVTCDDYAVIYAVIEYIGIDMTMLLSNISVTCDDKILERLIYARVEPLVDPLLPKEQAGFRRGKSTVD